MSYGENVKSVFVLEIPFGKKNSISCIDTKDIPVVNVPAPTIVIKKRKVPLNIPTGGRCIPSRYICVLLGFLSCVLLTTQRLNLSMGMVAMVNRTALHQTMGENATHSECPAPLRTAPSIHYPQEHHIIEGHLLWDTETQNHIVSASFLGYVLTQIPGGRMSEIIGGKQVLVVSLILASLCNVASPLVAEWSAYALMVIQFVKGLAQGMIQPAVSCLMARWFPNPEKGFLSSLTFSGYPFGAVIGGLSIGTMCDSHFIGGWPMGFYTFGFLGLILAFLVYEFTFNCPDDDSGISEAEYKYIISNIENRNDDVKLKTPWIPIASSGATWALLAGMFGQYWITFYFVSVHPTYLSSVLHFTNTESGYLNSLPYLGQMVVTWLSSYVSDILVNKGYASTDVLRKTCNTLSCFGFSISFLLVTYAGCDKMLNVILFVIAMSSAGFGYPGSNIVALDMTTAFAGTLIGIGSTFASCSGFIIPLVVGSLTSQAQTLVQWEKVFYISSGISLVSGVIFALFGSAEMQDWDKKNLDSKESEGIVNEGYDKTKENSTIKKMTINSFDKNWATIQRQ